MITEKAVVTAINSGQIEVRIERGNACGDCELNSQCGTGAIGKLLGNRNRPLLLQNDRHYVVGDHIVIGISEQSIYRACLLIYGLPLMFMIAVAMFLVMLQLPEFAVVAGSILSLFAGFSLTSKLSGTIYRKQFQPEILDRNSQI